MTGDVEQAIAALPPGRRIVAIDDRDGAGKTTFADAIAPRVGRATVRASADDFLNPRERRYTEGMRMYFAECDPRDATLVLDWG